jgi:hypothetical protein
MSQITSNDVSNPGPSSVNLRKTTAFREFPWLNGVTLVEGKLENYINEFGGELEKDHDAYIAIKARFTCSFSHITNNPFI